MDPTMLLMFALVAVLIFFMFRNGKKRQQAQQQLQNNMHPGVEVMLQSGIYAVIESIDEEENRARVRSGESTLIVHRGAITQIVTQSEASESAEASEPLNEVAPDDDPAFDELSSPGDNAADAADASDEEHTR